MLRNESKIPSPGPGAEQQVSRPFMTGVFLCCLLLAGCVSDQETQKEARQQFVSMMNRAIGEATYEEILTTFGPPSRKQESASIITGVWEEPSMHGERVQMIFDRRSQLLKSWNFQPR